MGKCIWDRTPLWEFIFFGGFQQWFWLWYYWRLLINIEEENDSKVDLMRSFAQYIY